MEQMNEVLGDFDPSQIPKDNNWEMSSEDEETGEKKNKTKKIEEKENKLKRNEEKETIKQTQNEQENCFNGTETQSTSNLNQNEPPQLEYTIPDWISIIESNKTIAQNEIEDKLLTYVEISPNRPVFNFLRKFQLEEIDYENRTEQKLSEPDKLTNMEKEAFMKLRNNAQTLRTAGEEKLAMEMKEDTCQELWRRSKDLEDKICNERSLRKSQYDPSKEDPWNGFDDVTARMNLEQAMKNKEIYFKLQILAEKKVETNQIAINLIKEERKKIWFDLVNKYQLDDIRRRIKDLKKEKSSKQPKNEEEKKELHKRIIKLETEKVELKKEINARAKEEKENEKLQKSFWNSCLSAILRQPIETEEENEEIQQQFETIVISDSEEDQTEPENHEKQTKETHKKEITISNTEKQQVSYSTITKAKQIKQFAELTPLPGKWPTKREGDRKSSMESEEEIQQEVPKNPSLGEQIQMAIMLEREYQHKNHQQNQAHIRDKSKEKEETKENSQTHENMRDAKRKMSFL